jgi:lipopolysaccharide/colanic/teichoic acid biosynthesis glycosyltransferase
MSLVGPRPLPTFEFERVPRWYENRQLAKPGLTGLWQITGTYELTFDEMMRLDYLYIANRSLWLDLKIALRTVPAVIRRRGAF